MRYELSFEPGADIPPPAQHRRRSTIDEALDEVIAQQIGETRHFKVTSTAEDLRHPRRGA